MNQKINLTKNYKISRVVKGGWQLAGGHGLVERDQSLKDMKLFTDAGITTFDCADIYTGVEELIGAFMKEVGEGDTIQIHTKFVPDADILSDITPHYIEKIIDRSLRRLGTRRIDLVQLHWWDFSVPNYLQTAQILHALQRAGRIRHLGVTNFDVAHLDELIKAGIPIVSNQVQFSVLDRRPLVAMTNYCRQNNIKLLCYGTVAGGFLSERYLGVPAPAGPDENRSLTKYRLIIEDCGGWEVFQKLLVALKKVGDRHKAPISSIASAFILAEPTVASVIIGARNTDHLEENCRVASLRLSQKDIQEINHAISVLTPLTGDVYHLERDRNGRHGKIMKYNLNKK